MGSLHEKGWHFSSAIWKEVLRRSVWELFQGSRPGGLMHWFKPPMPREPPKSPYCHCRASTVQGQILNTNSYMPMVLLLDLISLDMTARDFPSETFLAKFSP